MKTKILWVMFFALYFAMLCWFFIAGVIGALLFACGLFFSVTYMMFAVTDDSL